MNTLVEYLKRFKNNTSLSSDEEFMIKHHMKLALKRLESSKFRIKKIEHKNGKSEYYAEKYVISDLEISRSYGSPGHWRELKSKNFMDGKPCFVYSETITNLRGNSYPTEELALELIEIYKKEHREHIEQTLPILKKQIEARKALAEIKAKSEELKQQGFPKITYKEL